MNEDDITRYLTGTFAGVDLVKASDNIFYFYNPDPEDPDHRFPIVTLMTNDDNDQFSNLSRPGIYRLNIGVSKQTYRALFGTPTDGADNEGGYDFTALDRVMPHPVYGRQYWICILNPSPATFQTTVQPLLAEAYDLAVAKRARHAART
jgi:hypothetical protein